jgi:hypothetical protein
MKKFTTTRVRRLAGLAIIVSVCFGASVPAATAASASAHASGSVTSQACSNGAPWEDTCS